LSAINSRFPHCEEVCARWLAEGGRLTTTFVFADDSWITRRAVINATDWLVRHNCRNVIIDIANEYDLSEWEYDPWIPNNIGELIELARGRFTPNFRLPIGASTKGMAVSSSTGDHADLTMIHGNTRTPEEKRKRVAELFADSKALGRFSWTMTTVRIRRARRVARDRSVFAPESQSSDSVPVMGKDAAPTKRERFRKFWARLSRVDRRRRGRPATTADIRRLIEWIVAANPLWKTFLHNHLGQWSRLISLQCRRSP
jgi:hypothetical protein